MAIPALHIHTFDNGLVLLAEPMDGVESVSWSLLLPYGPVLDPPNLEGLAGLVCEMTLRGAGSRNSREFLCALENLGCETAEALAHLHTGFGSSTLAENLLPSLELLADQVLRPRFPKDQLEAAKQVRRQNLFSLEDDPARQLMEELSRNFLPDPWGRSELGTLETLERISLDDIRDVHARFYQPQGAILSCAGRFDWNVLQRHVENLFGNNDHWKPQNVPQIEERPIGKIRVHLPFESAQTHIGVAYPCAELRSTDYMLAWSAVNVLSGGMSGRLFDEIREKRGLCYSVCASYSTLRDRAGVYCYCGTGADRAQESLDVLLSELERLRNGIDEGELRRLKIRAKRALVMQQESTGSRSSTMTRDWYHLDRIRTLAEIEAAIDGLTLNAINDYLAKKPPGPFHIVTLGPFRAFDGE